jgi:hypothetical protein
LAISRPIVVTACMASSSESWEPYRRPHLWHSRAGGGAVHSIKTGLMHCNINSEATGYIAALMILRKDRSLINELFLRPPLVWEFKLSQRQFFPHILI